MTDLNRKMQLARELFGGSAPAASSDATRRTTGTAKTASDGGRATVEFADGGEMECECLCAVGIGDIVTVLVQDGKAVVIGVTGWGDIVQEKATTAQTTATAAKETAETAVQSVAVEYALGDSQTAAPGEGWSQTAPAHEAGKYMWQRTTVTTSKGSTTSAPTCIQGADGQSGKATYTWLKYADTPTSGMSDDPTGKAYIGIAYNKDTPTESTAYGDYSWSLIKGEKGDTGATGPQGEKGETGATGATGAQGPQGEQGETGAKGDTGNGIASIAYRYAKTSTSTAPAASKVTATTPPTIDATDKWLWQKETITYTSGSSQTTVTLLAVYGDTGDTGAQGPQGEQGIQGEKGDTGATGAQGPKGEKGDTGAQGPQGEQGDKGDTGAQGDTGASVSKVKMQYAIAASSTTAPTYGWQDSVPDWQSGKYIWQRSVTTITAADGTATTDTSAAVLYGAFTTLAEGVETAQGTADAAKQKAEEMEQHFFHDSTGAHVSDTAGALTGRHVDIDSDGLTIADGTTELATFGASKIELGKSSTSATVEMCGGSLRMGMYGKQCQIATAYDQMTAGSAVLLAPFKGSDLAMGLLVDSSKRPTSMLATDRVAYSVDTGNDSYPISRIRRATRGSFAQGTSTSTTSLDISGGAITKITLNSLAQVCGVGETGAVESTVKDFSLSSGGIKCNFSGYVTVQGSAYINSSNSAFVGCYIFKNSTEVLAGITPTSSAFYAVGTPAKMVQVASGDVIYLKARAPWGSATGNVDCDNSATYLLVERIS